MFTLLLSVFYLIVKKTTMTSGCVYKNYLLKSTVCTQVYHMLKDASCADMNIAIHVEVG